MENVFKIEDVMRNVTADSFSEISEELLCNICQEPTLDWVQACRGGQHSFCKNCLEQHVATSRRNGMRPWCPSCRGEIQFDSNNKLQVDRIRKALTEEYQVRCTQACGHTCRLGQLKNHLEKECPETMCTCPGKIYGCLHQAKRCEMEAHLRDEDAHKHMAVSHMMKLANDVSKESKKIHQEFLTFLKGHKMTDH